MLNSHQSAERAQRPAGSGSTGWRQSRHHKVSLKWAAADISRPPRRVAVSREHRRAKTDRLDTELLKRGFLGWLRGERGHCSMARVPTIAEEDAKRPNRERECLVG